MTKARCPQTRDRINVIARRRNSLKTAMTSCFVFATLLIVTVGADIGSSLDAARYIPASPGKTVVSRPAMRISRVRIPTGSRRIYMRTRRPILTSNRGYITSHPTSTYIRRIRPKIELVPDERPRTRVTYEPTSFVSKTTNATENIPTAPAATISSQPISTAAEETTSKAPLTTPAATRAYRPTQTTRTHHPTTATFARKSSRLRNMSILHALRRMNKEVDYSGLLKKLDYFMAYYPTVREAAARLGNMLSKHEHASREERRRIWKGVFRVKSEVRGLRGKCEGIYRNISDVRSKIGRHVNELTSYQESARKKIGQIEIHQGSQDQQYFEVYERSSNNSKELRRLQADMSILLPLVTELVRSQEQKTIFEKRALEQLDSQARGNIAEMANQILIQQNTLVNLGTKVRSEIEQLHQQKQSMSRSMDQHQKRLTDAVNSHVSMHVKQLTDVENTLNRQAENVKYILSVIGNHGQLLDDAHAVEQEVMRQVDNMTRDIKDLKKNCTECSEQCERNELRLGAVEAKVENLKIGSNQIHVSLSDQHAILGETLGRMNFTEGALKLVTDELRSYQTDNDLDSEQVREELDKLWEKHDRLHHNVSKMIQKQTFRERFAGSSQYPSDEPAPEATSVTPRELMSLLAELGVEDRMTRLTRVLRHQQQRMSNVTRAVLRIAEDNEAIALTTSHYYNLINSQTKIISDQNDTIGKLALIASNQGQTIKSLTVELGGAQETVMKLTNIIASIASQMKSPMGSQRDCHDVWLNGNRKSGVYNVIEDMSVRPMHCNLTDYGGWTVIQRRKDGSQDFDRTMKDYKYGFGDVYGEHWLGLDTIKTLTQKVRSSVGLQIIMEDWEGNFRHATYSQFYLYGENYNIQVSGFHGDVGNSLSLINGSPFSAKSDGVASENSSCPHKWKGGWWFPPLPTCGEVNLNGLYQKVPKSENLASTTLHWKRWRNVRYPLKSVTMQIIPTDVLNKLFADVEEESSEDVQETIDIDSAAPGNPKSTINDLQYKFRGSSYRELLPSYRHNSLEANRQDGVDYGGDAEDSQILMGDSVAEYDNLDFNIFLGDG